MKIRLLRKALWTFADEEDSVEEVADCALAAAIREGESRRYLFRRSRYREAKDDRFEQDLNDYDTEDKTSSLESEASAIPCLWLTEDEFLHKYRVSRKAFGHIVCLIENHPIFQCKTKGRKQAPILAHQLMVFLKYIGTEGSGGSNANQHHTFAIGYGTSPKFCRRVTRAILCLRDQFLFWPDKAECKQTSWA
jgi:hypothetical protein